MYGYGDVVYNIMYKGMVLGNVTADNEEEAAKKAKAIYKKLPVTVVRVTPKEDDEEDDYL